MCKNDCKECRYERVCDELEEIYSYPIVSICGQCQDYPDDLSECASSDCPLNAFIRGDVQNPRDMINAIKLYCLECGEVECAEDWCPFYPFRVDPLFDSACSKASPSKVTGIT
jgi:hypothetical protein